jgi:hypothetical protein
MRTYSLWDVEANNLLGHYTTEPEALRTVNELLDTFGLEYADEIVLGGRDEYDRPLRPIGGEALAQLARRSGQPLPAATVRVLRFRLLRSAARKVRRRTTSRLGSGRTIHERADSLRAKVFNK